MHLSLRGHDGSESVSPRRCRHAEEFVWKIADGDFCDSSQTVGPPPLGVNFPSIESVRPNKSAGKN
jgi:hypothetical protein